MDFLCVQFHSTIKHKDTYVEIALYLIENLLKGFI